MLVCKLVGNGTVPATFRRYDDVGARYFRAAAAVQLDDMGYRAFRKQITGADQWLFRGRSCHTTNRGVPKSIEYQNGDDHYGSSHYWSPHARSVAAASGNDSSFRVVSHEDARHDYACPEGYPTGHTERDTEAAVIGSLTGEASCGGFLMDKAKHFLHCYSRLPLIE